MGKKKRRKVDYEKVTGVSKNVSLHDIHTIAFSASSNRLLAGTDVQTLEQEIGVRGEFLNTEDNLGIVRIDFEYSAVMESEKIANVNGALLAIYELKPDLKWEGFKKSEKDQFGEVNGIYNTWSYIRELVASSLTRLGLSGVLLPVWHPPADLPPKGEFSIMKYSPDNQ